MRFPLVAVVVVLSASCATPSPEEEEEEAAVGEGEGDGDGVALADCDTVVGGIALDDGLVEDVDDFDARLADLDLDALPAVVRVDGASDFFVNVLAYALDLDRADVVEHGLDRDVVRRTRMGQAMLGSFLADDADPIDFAFLRQGFHRFYACSRGLPTTLAGFRALVGEARFDERVLATSQPKRGPRRLLEDAALGVFVAETLADDDTVRETEIVWSGRRNDGLLDFVVYDEHGALSAASRFASNGGGTVASAAPYTCLFCHGADDGSFSVVFPD